MEQFMNKTAGIRLGGVMCKIMLLLRRQPPI